MTLLSYLLLASHRRNVLFCWQWNKITKTGHSYPSKLSEEKKSRDLLPCPALPEKQKWCWGRALGTITGWRQSTSLKVSFQEQHYKEQTKKPQKTTHFQIYLNRKNICDFFFFNKFFERTAPLFCFNVYNDTFQSSRYLAADHFGLSKGTPAIWQSAGRLGSNRDELHWRRHGELERWAGNKT